MNKKKRCQKKPNKRKVERLHKMQSLTTHNDSILKKGSNRIISIQTIMHIASRIKRSKKSKSKSKVKILATLLSILKVIVAVMTLTATIWGTYYTWKSYLDSKPAQVHKIFKYKDKTIYVDSVSKFKILLEPHNTNMYILGRNDDNSESYPFPIIINKSNKSINNFKVFVNAYLWGFTYFDDDVNKNFRIIKKDSVPLLITLELEYKYDVLHANSSISNPINYVIPIDYMSERYMSFDFHITYDGIIEPLKYSVLLEISDDTYSYKLRDEEIDKFLSLCYSQGALLSKDTLIAIQHRYKSYILCNNKNSAIPKEEFEKYKSIIIKNYHEEY